MLESVATVYRAKIGRDAASGVTQTFQVIWKNIPCHIDTSASPGNMLYAQRQDEASGTLWFYGDPGCQVNDYVQTIDRNGIVTFFQVLSGGKPIGRHPLRSYEVKHTAAPNGLNRTIG